MRNRSVTGSAVASNSTRLHLDMHLWIGLDILEPVRFPAPGGCNIDHFVQLLKLQGGNARLPGSSTGGR